MVNARLCESGAFLYGPETRETSERPARDQRDQRPALFFTSPKNIDFIDREREELRLLKFEPQI